MLTLAETKLFLRVDDLDSNGHPDDTLIEAMMGAATAATLDYLNLDGFDSNGMPDPVKAATLLLVGDLYENRELQADRQLYRNETYARLLNPYRAMEA